MFFGNWPQRHEMLSPNKVALIESVPSTEFILSEVDGLRTGNDNEPITYREWNQRARGFAEASLSVSESDLKTVQCASLWGW